MNTALPPLAALFADPAVTSDRHVFFISEAHVVVGLISGLVTIVAVLLHYEAMSLLSNYVPRMMLQRRPRIVLVILGMLLLHVIEVWLFAALFYVLELWPSLGRLEGPIHEGALDFVYFSVVTYTSLGLGDVVPEGPIRILAGTETLVGLTLITWTASFAFLEMQRDWREFRRPPQP